MLSQSWFLIRKKSGSVSGELAHLLEGSFIWILKSIVLKKKLPETLSMWGLGYIYLSSKQLCSLGMFTNLIEPDSGSVFKH